MKLLCTFETFQELKDKKEYFKLKNTDFAIKPKSGINYPTFATIEYLNDPGNFNYFKRCFLNGKTGYIVRTNK